MKSIPVLCLTCGLTAALAAGAAEARRVGARPINLAPPTGVDVALAQRSDARAASRGHSRRHFAPPPTAGFVAAPSPRVSGTTPPLPAMTFRDSGPLHRDVQIGYRDFTESVSRHVWTDPAGRRVIFDVNGRPGVGVEIPLH